jgi:hypothetical protein
MAGEERKEPPQSPKLPAWEAQYLREHGGYAEPEAVPAGEYERLVEETAKRIEATRMTVDEVAALFGVEPAALERAVVDAQHIGLVMHTPQNDLRDTYSGEALTPLEWLRNGGSPDDVWVLLTSDTWW